MLALADIVFISLSLLLSLLLSCKDNDFLNLVAIPIASKEKKETIFRLDFDYFTTSYNKNLDKKDIDKWLQKGHDVINKYFEKIITPKTRKLFD